MKQNTATCCVSASVLVVFLTGCSPRERYEPPVADAAVEFVCYDRSKTERITLSPRAAAAFVRLVSTPPFVEPGGYSNGTAKREFEVSGKFYYWDGIQIRKHCDGYDLVWGHPVFAKMYNIHILGRALSETFGPLSDLAE